MAATLNHITNRISKKLGVNADGDLQVCFGSSQTSQYWYFVTNAANINKWARFKPFRHPSGANYFDHYDDNASTRKAAAASVNYGLSAPQPQQNFLNTFGNEWTYDHCQSGDQMESWDFEGYNGDASAPVSSPGNIDVYLSSGADFSFGAYIAPAVSGGDTISWDDLPGAIGSGQNISVGNCYLCVIFSKTSDFANTTGNLIAKTSAQVISNSGLTLDITYSELQQLYANGYKYYYIVARTAQLSGLQDPATNSAYYVGLPSANNTNDLKGEFTIHAAAVASILIVGVNRSQNPGGAARFVSAANFLGPESITPQDSEYFNYEPALTPPPPPYYIHFKLEVTAGSAALTIGNPRVALSQTFFSANGYSNPVSCDLYDDTYTQRTQITIAANQTATIYLVASSALFSLAQNGHQESSFASDQHFSAIVKFYNGSTLIDQGNEFRVRNYSFNP